ncbi:transposase [Sedimentitalea sp.]|uniref:transposase n=1 Tax=Sedimentitalea sp. TaxID=2048915 RepID=UPI003296C571
MWSAPPRTTRGGQRKYSDLAVGVRLTLSVVLHQPLRQTQGLMRNVVRLLGVEIRGSGLSGFSRIFGLIRRFSSSSQ